MSSSPAANILLTDSSAAPGNTRHILSFTYFTFICYIVIGLPLAVLPPFVHLRMGYNPFWAGLIISIQYIATLSSRPWAGRISDRLGAKVSVLWGLAACGVSGPLLIAAAALHHLHGVSFAVLVASRLLLGTGESLAATGATLWGIHATGPESTAKVIGYNGICTYGGMALGAPLGVLLDARWGLSSIGVVTIILCAVSFALAARKAAVMVEPGEHLPFTRVLGRVFPHGMGMALSGVGYSVLATFVTLFYASRHWSGAALCLTGFGAGYIVIRASLIHTIERFGGFPVAKVSLVVEAAGAFLLWRASSPWMALAGAVVCGFGISLVFPSLGVEVVKRVPEFSRGTALGVYTAFSDVSFFLVGPIAGTLIGFFGYPSIFLFALISILVSLGIVFVLHWVQNPEFP